jgi:LacI family transcriptional regulator
MAPLVRIGLVFDYSLDFCRCVVHGIKRYAEAKPRWTFLSLAPQPRELGELHHLRPHGLIAHVFSAPLARTLGALRKPLVNVSSVVELPLPRVAPDDVLIGRLAATHLLDHGFRQFAWVGHPRFYYAVRQEQGFREVIEAAGYTVSYFRDRSERSFHPRGRLWAFDPKVHRWLRALPKPVASLASNDLWGVQLTEACHQEGLRVPEDVALLGVDNDALLCELARPSLSSVAIPSEKVGYEAAALLDRLLAGGPAPEQPLLLPPLGVVTRQSSDILAISNPDVVAALRFIRAHSHQPLRVTDVLREVPVGRRSLERQFRQVLHRGIWEEIRRVHLERAKTLLATTALPIAEVARGAGFVDNRNLSVVFRQALGLSPTAYRRQIRGEADGAVG